VSNHAKEVRLRPFCRVMARVVLLACILSSLGYAADWHQWLGPTRDGVAPGTPPVKWPDQLTLRWKIKTASGASAPITAQGLVYVQGQTGKEETVIAVDLEKGTESWPWKHPNTSELHGEADEFAPASTPCFHDGKLYVHSMNSALVCLEAKTGKELWKRDLKAELKKKGPAYGPAASPLVVDGFVILPVGDEAEGSAIAFDATKGTTAWEVKTSAPGYGSPIATTLSDASQLIMVGLNDLQGLVKKDGKYEKAWDYAFRAGEGNQTTPAILGKDMLVITNESETHALRIKQADGKWKAELAWKSELNGKMASPHVFDGRVYLHAQRELYCLAGENGKELSKLEVPGEYCSLVRLGSLLLCQSQSGSLTVVDAAQSEMKKIAEYKSMDGDAWCHLGVAGTNLLVRGRSEVRCYTWEGGK